MELGWAVTANSCWSLPPMTLTEQFRATCQEVEPSRRPSATELGVLLPSGLEDSHQGTTLEQGPFQGCKSHQNCQGGGQEDLDERGWESRGVSSKVPAVSDGTPRSPSLCSPFFSQGWLTSLPFCRTEDLTLDKEVLSAALARSPTWTPLGRFLRSKSPNSSMSRCDSCWEPS